MESQKTQEKVNYNYRIKYDLTELQMFNFIEDIKQLDFIDEAYYDYPIGMGWTLTKDYVVTTPQQQKQILEIFDQHGIELEDY